MNAVNVNPDMTTFVCGGCGFAQRKTPAGGELSGVCRLCVSVAGVVLLGERGNLYFCNKVITNALPRGVVTTDVPVSSFVKTRDSRQISIFEFL